MAAKKDVSARIEAGVHRKATAYCKKNGVSAKHFMSRAIEAYLEDQKK